MSSPDEAWKKQLANILTTTGLNLEAHAAEVAKTSYSKHMEILKFLKSEYSLGHGNANLLATKVREILEGSSADDTQLLEAQYAGAKGALIPMRDELFACCNGMGGDVKKVVQKTGVAFRRNKLFALIQAPSAKRLQLGLNLSETPDDRRVEALKGMCSHKVVVQSADDIDDTLVSWIRQSYDRC